MHIKLRVRLLNRTLLTEQATACVMESTRSRVKTLLCLALTCAVIAGCARHSDRDWVIREFNVPQEVELLVQSSPEDESHWIDRKNLLLTATFKFTPTQFLDYNKSLENKTVDWHALPFSPELQKSLIERFSTASASTALKNAAHGFYYLKTAEGTNLLKSTRRLEWQLTSPDVELGILNADSAELKVFVKQ
jgi:hypothetical protein